MVVAWPWAQRPQPAQFFSVYIADFWQTFWVFWENRSEWSNLGLNMSIPTLGRLKTHEIPHLHHNYRKFMPLSRHQLKIYAFSVKFNVCSKWVLLLWIKICRDFTPETQIFTQRNESWLRFYSEFLSKKLAAGVSAWTILWSIPAAPLGLAYSHRKVILTFVLIHNESDNWILSILGLNSPFGTLVPLAPTFSLQY